MNHFIVIVMSELMLVEGPGYALGIWLKKTYLIIHHHTLSLSALFLSYTIRYSLLCVVMCRGCWDELIMKIIEILISEIKRHPPLHDDTTNFAEFGRHPPLHDVQLRWVGHHLTLHVVSTTPSWTSSPSSWRRLASLSWTPSRSYWRPTLLSCTPYPSPWRRPTSLSWTYPKEARRAENFAFS